MGIQILVCKSHDASGEIQMHHKDSFSKYNGIAQPVKLQKVQLSHTFFYLLRLGFSFS